jgi:hypothetical protein
MRAALTEAVGKEVASGRKSKDEPGGAGKRMEHVFPHLKRKTSLKHLEIIVDRYIWSSTNSQGEHLEVLTAA